MSKKNLILIIIVLIVVALGLFAVMMPKDKTGAKIDTSYIKLGEYKGLSYTIEKVEVTEDDVKNRIETELYVEATQEDVKTGKVENDDTVNIDYEGSVNGKEFLGSEAKDYVFQLGQDILPFEDEIPGMDIGEEKTVKVKLPKDYQDENVQGKDAEYKVKVNYAIRYNKPEYDKEYFKKRGFDSKEEYEKNIRKTIEKEKKDAVKTSVEESLLSQVVDSSKYTKKPDKLVEDKYDKIMKSYENAAKEYKLSLDDYREYYVKSPKKKFEEDIKAAAELQVKEEMVVAAIAEKENIKLDKEYDAYLIKMLNGTGFTEESFEKEYNKTYEEYAKENDYDKQFLRDKVKEIILKYGKETK